MYKFDTKAKREDVIALRWPKACLSCGSDMPEDSHPRYAIVGLFYVEKKHTQVLVKLPGHFYTCNTCSREISSQIGEPSQKPSKLEQLALNLMDNPWNEFIELTKHGVVKIPDGSFKSKLQEANPDASFGTKTCPLSLLRQSLERNREVS
ncbi:MAG: hypothetical protein ACFFAY_12910 [Promethearchaeota archaeon]